MNLSFGFPLALEVRSDSFVIIFVPVLSLENVSLSPRRTPANPFSPQTLLCFIDTVGQSDCQSVITPLAVYRLAGVTYCKGYTLALPSSL